MSKINPVIYGYYDSIRFLRSVQGIVAEIVDIDNNLYDFNEERAITTLSYYINKYAQVLYRTY